MIIRLITFFKVSIVLFSTPRKNVLLPRVTPTNYETNFKPTQVN